MENQEKKDDFGCGSQFLIVLVVCVVLLIAMFSGKEDPYDAKEKEVLNEAESSEGEVNDNSNKKVFTEKPTSLYNKDSFLLQKIHLFDNSLEIINSSQIDGILYSLNQVTDLYEEGWNLVESANNTGLNWLIEAAKTLAKKLENSQSKSLPKWRNKYVEILDYKLSYDNIEVSFNNNTLVLKGFFYNESDIETNFMNVRQYCMFSRIKKVKIHNLLNKYYHTRTFFEGKDSDPY